MHQLLRILTKRFSYAAIQLFGASIVIFVIVRLLPGDPVTTLLGAVVQPEQIEAQKHRLGLDKSVVEQYWIWLKNFFNGDLGTSFVTSNPVITDLGQRLPATFELILLALFVTIVVLVPLGVLSARRSRSIYVRTVDRGVHTYGMFAGATPDFWLAILLVVVFYTQVGWAPAPLGRLDIAMAAPPDRTGFLTIDSIIAGRWDAFWNAVAHLAMPVATLTFVYGAPILKMTRQTVTRMLESEFIQQGRAAGLSEFTLLRIALKNSLPPVITLGGVTFGYVIGGAVLVETVFAWGGFGQYAVQAIGNADFFAIQGFVLVATALSIVIFLIVDLLHYAIDPRLEMN